MVLLVKQIKWFYHEFGIKSLYDTGWDAWLIILTRCTRMFAYGTNSLILALFFSALEFSDFRIGLFMTLTLLGDVLLSVLLTLVADRLGRRKILFAGSFLMVLSGIAFALFENFWILLFAAVVGVISATGSDFGPFRAIEESTLSHLTTPKTRPDVLAWYITTASIGSALGVELTGRVVHYLQHSDGWTIVDAYHTVFWIYSAMGGVNMILTLLLSKKCEVNNEVKAEREEDEAGVLLDDTEERDSEETAAPSPTVISEPPNPEKKSRFAQISQATRSVMYKLWFLLIVDSLADGMVGYSLTTYYMDKKFDLRKSTLGDITSISYVLSSCSTVFAGPLSRRLGLINTMVFTHLPSSAAVLLFPLPSSIFFTVALFFVRTGLNNMDQAPRSAFIAAVVKPEERTAVMGITSMLRTLAATAGPSVTGILAGNDRFWIAFVAAGALRIAYDLGLWAMFVNMTLHQHEEKGESKEVDRGLQRESDEEELRDLPRRPDEA
ncbi:MFS general substrate transporter [Hyaloscypha variabilis]|uniref:MFS general substrate transporter n=1 Tax=Hyaloscypha variabilis (strain UAMH 11265 / GT02V1 / F) TaxID=1149755 RepID=A0A2J6QTR9_HYAVF|nr:MFS general substrate transporter [Hyaloscypha variabilis F]